MKEVFNAHPFFPNVFAPNPQAIRERAEKKYMNIATSMNYEVDGHIYGRIGQVWLMGELGSVHKSR
jgi:hypothetical protein